VSNVKEFAERHLASLGVEVDNIQQSRCHFCHSEIANPQVKQNIENQGHSIIQL
jgi:hypothetical protein